jgi:methylenetetrahydrofolate dehydrogenase (NADP+)/methenyltetrahydrofolate cyclohydrolase
MKILDGKAVSEKILSETKVKIDTMCHNNAIPRPSLAIVIVGNNPASETYVKAKIRACENAG